MQPLCSVLYALILIISDTVTFASIGTVGCNFCVVPNATYKVQVTRVLPSAHVLSFKQRAWFPAAKAWQPTDVSDSNVGSFRY